MSEKTPSLHIYIVSWVGFHNNSVSIANELSLYFDRVTIVFSDPDTGLILDVNCAQIKRPNNLFWSDKFKACIDDVDSDLMLVIHGDCSCQDWRALVKRCRDACHRFPEIGVWQPLIDWTPFTLNKTEIDNLSDESLRIVALADGIVFALDRRIVERMRMLDYTQNIYGWGIEWTFTTCAYTQNKLVVVDKSIFVRHPKTRGYSSKKAGDLSVDFIRQMNTTESVLYKALGVFVSQNIRNLKSVEVSVDVAHSTASVNASNQQSAANAIPHTKIKYLLCRPRGGLNDALNQIEKCWRYSEIYERVLIIDTEYLISTGISVKFSSLFEVLDRSKNIILDLSKALLDNLNQLDTFPPSCKGRLAAYKAKLNEKLYHYDCEKNVLLSFDFNRNYEEDLLLHDQFGGGAIGINCLARLKLTSGFRGDVLSYLLPLIGESHMAIHIRNADYQTDYKSAFKNIYNQSINERLLICTDSVEVLNYATDFFDQSKTLSLNSPPNTSGTGLATYATYYSTDQQRYDLIVQAFADLIGMATAKKIFFCKLSPGEFAIGDNKYSDLSNIFNTKNANQLVPIGINGFSGFSLLAGSLRNQPSLINQLLTS